MSTVLVVEDEQPIRENIVELLEVSGYHTVAAENGQRGIALAREHDPDLIVCDVMMPHIDGHDVLRRIRDTESLASTPFVFLTAKSAEEDMRKGMMMGADDYITKPFRATELLGAIEARLERRDQLQHKQRARVKELQHTISTVLPHEMRTPLASIEGFARLLLEERAALEDRDIQEILQDILESVQRLERVAENNVLYAQLEARTNGLDDGEVAAGPVVERQARNQAQAHERQADLTLDVADARVAMGEMYFTKVVDEIVDNAFKFSASQTPVQVEAVPRDDGTYRLAVTDHGRGMTPEQVDRIQAFSQFDRIRHEQQGLGLGLVLTRKICERFGGALSIESTPEVSTTVQLTLPHVTEPQAG